MPRPGETRGEYRRRRAQQTQAQSRVPRGSRRVNVVDEPEEEEPTIPHRSEQAHQDSDQQLAQLLDQIEAAMHLEDLEDRGGKKSKQQRPKVMLPKVTSLPPVHDVPEIRTRSQKRTPKHQSETKPSTYAHHLKNGRRFFQKFILPFTYDELVAAETNRKTTLAQLQPEIDRMEDELYPIQAASALFYTSDERLVFVYLGSRTSDMVTLGKDEYMDLADCTKEERLQETLEQKEKAAQEAKEEELRVKERRRKHGQRPLKSNVSPLQDKFLYFHDGFGKSMMDRFPNDDTTYKRHGVADDGRTYHYFDLEKGVKFTCKESESRKLVMSDDDGITGFEPAGTHHMAEGWPQQGHSKKELYLASALSGSGQSTLATRYFYQANEVLEKCVAAAVKEFFPEYYKVGAQVREAGRAVPTSDGLPCGMYLARAVIFKLQVLMHSDQRDFGVSSSFPCGYFEGGYLIVPQLKSKFRYSPGDLAIFYAGLIFHKVATWKARKMKTDDIVAPGRVGMVMFNPAASVEVLNNKEAKFSEKTMYGKLPTTNPGRKEMPPKKKRRVVS
ncbi:hypothetical protein V5O48_004502 [Marasmius crinis-equi]|uniref:Uncharacterized protein n=1 Tax=Marasmius crinis-equi TaxID=585013 RepID=A0ABR3FPX9_9AGAR